MKKAIKISLFIAAVVIISCKKKEADPVNPAAPSTTTYLSLSDFYFKNGVPKQTFTINASVGGSFVTPQATTVNIPANAFITAANVPVTGTVAIEFKDIYKKSDMLLSNVATSMTNGWPLESAGEFFIKATANNIPVLIDTASAIVVNQPLIPGAVGNFSMQAFAGGLDTANNAAWVNSPNVALTFNASNYVFSLYNFSMPVANGTWCNSDNAYYFSGYPQTTLTLHPNFNQAGYYIDMFLVFKNVNSMVHVYQDYIGGIDFSYSYAPVGLQCTVVAVALKGGKLYASFTPITISNNQTVNFNVAEMSDADFKTSLNALN